MVSYGQKVTGNKPYDFRIKKPEVKTIDYDDMANRNMKEKSEFGKLMTHQQREIQSEAKEIKKYLTEAFKSMKHCRLASKREQNELFEKQF